MSLFSFLHRRASSDERPVPECRHLELGPRWLSAEDIGKNDRATSFVCASCGRSFTPEEAKELGAARVA